MGFIGDEKEIKEKTKGEGYGVGELYVYETLKCAREDAKIFDTDRYNFHLYPEDKTVMKKIADEVNDIRNEVIKRLKEQGACVNRHEFDKHHKDDDTIYVSAEIDEKNEVVARRGCGANGNIQELSGEYNQLYRFIAARKKDILYELNFMRFFIDRENKVNCILKAIQFDRCMKESVNQSVKGGCDICYPNTSEAQSEEDLKYILKNRKGESFCYNPPVSFYDTADNIAEAFIDFINECDKWSSGNK